MIDQLKDIEWAELQALIEALFIADEDVLAIVWVAVIDESGTHAQSSHVAVASVTATAVAWQKLMKQWEKTLKDYGLTYFHATEFNSGSEECAKLSVEQRVSCVKNLIRVASSFDLEYVAYVIERRLFDSEVEKHVLSEPLSIYDYLLVCVVGDLMIRGAVEDDLWGISVQVESGCPLTTNLIQKLMKAAAKGRILPLRNIIYGDSSYDHFQVADMIAYDSYKYFEKHAVTPDAPLRKSFQRIIDGNPLRPYLIDKDWLNADLLQVQNLLNKIKCR